MRLEFENGPPLKLSSRKDLQEALAIVGKGNNGFAVLAKAKKTYIQTTGTVLKGFQIEVRDGSEDRHFYSKRTNIPHSEMIDIFLSYFDGKEDWKSSLQWKPLIKSPRIKPPRKKKLATYKNAMITLIVSTLLLWGSVAQRRQTEDFEQHFGQTTGIVLSAKLTGVHSKWLHITMRYDADGKEYVKEEKLSGVTYHAGDKVPIVYDKRDPGGIQFVRKPEEIWREYYSLLFVGFALGVISVILFIIARLSSVSA